MNPMTRLLNWTQYNYADMRLRRGDPIDRGKAQSLLAEAIESAQAGGWKLVLDKALALKMRFEGTASVDVRTSIDTVADTASSAFIFRTPSAPARSVLTARRSRRAGSSDLEGIIGRRGISASTSGTMR